MSSVHSLVPSVCSCSSSSVGCISARSTSRRRAWLERRVSIDQSGAPSVIIPTPGNPPKGDRTQLRSSAKLLGVDQDGNTGIRQYRLYVSTGVRHYVHTSLQAYVTQTKRAVGIRKMWMIIQDHGYLLCAVLHAYVEYATAIMESKSELESVRVDSFGRMRSRSR